MGLFKTKDKTAMTVNKIEKEMEESKKELERREKELNDLKEIQKQKEQLNEEEDVIDFETEEAETKTEDLQEAINSYLIKNGIEPTLNFIGQIKNQLIVELAKENIIKDTETDKNDREEIQFQE